MARISYHTFYPRLFTQGLFTLGPLNYVNCTTNDFLHRTFQLGLQLGLFLVGLFSTALLMLLKVRLKRNLERG